MSRRPSPPPRAAFDVADYGMPVPAGSLHRWLPSDEPPNAVDAEGSTRIPGGGKDDDNMSSS
jgi:hypothetical protein